MNFYDLFMAPFENNGLRIMRQNLVTQAHGNCLELGVGSGANLEFYNLDHISGFIASDFDEPTNIKHKIAKKFNRFEAKGLNAEDSIKNLNVEALPFEDSSFDTVISTLIFCSVVDVAKGLSEIRRILKPNGQFIFIEHVISKAPVASTAMHLLTPAWKVIAHGCHLNRDFEASLLSSGFRIHQSQFMMGDVFLGGIAQVDIDE